MQVRSVAVVMAMGAEAAPVVERLSLSPVDPPGPELPFRWFGGSAHGLEVTVCVNGVDPRHGVDNIGTNPAVLNTWLAVERRRPDVVISAGTAGGFASAGGAIGDVYLSADDFVFHDRRIAIPGFDQYGHGRYPSADTSVLAAAVGAKRGVVSTSNSLDGPDLDLGIMAAHGAVVKEMEAASVAWVCWLTDTPVFAVKAITDLVDGPEETPDEFQANLARATATLADHLDRTLGALAELGLP